jgi:predicted phage tail protein
MFSGANLIGNLLFSSVGFVAFVYGKKQGLWKTAVLGIALMVYPYFVPNAWLMYGIGGALSAGLYFFRD